MMTVYPDLVFFQTFFLSWSSFSLSRVALDLPRVPRSVLVGSLFSAAASALSVVPAVPFWIQGLVTGLITLWLIRGKTLSGTVHNAVVGLGVFCFVFAGFLLFSCVLFGTSVAVTPLGVYFMLSFPGGVCSVGLSSGVTWLLLRIRAKRRFRTTIYDCSFDLEGKTVSVRCYGDSGNLLTDPATGFPVVILEFAVLRRSLSSSFPPPLSYEFSTRLADRARVVSYRSVSGAGSVLSAFLPERFCIEGVPREVVIAVTDRVLEKNGRFSGIVGPQLMEGVSV